MDLMRHATQHDRMQEVFSVFSKLPDTSYLHWDELRRRNPPSNLSLEEWWLALKLRRKSLYRPLPCKDKHGNCFQYALPDTVLQLLHKIDFNAGASLGAWDSNLDPALRDRYIFSSLTQEAISSSLLEGAVATREAAQDLIRTARTPRDKSEWMILNNFRAMQQISKIRDQPLSPELIFELHRILTSETLDDPNHAGRLRTAPVYVMDTEGLIHHEPPPANELHARLKALCAFANDPETGHTFIPPVIRAIILHFWLAYDHPFIDGNGRTARALFYWAMLRHGFWQFEFLSISGILHKAPAQYARSFLFTETDENDLTYFIIHQMETIFQAVQELHKYLERKRMEIQDAEQHLQAFRHLNHRQTSFISNILRHPDRATSLKGYQDMYRVAYATARSDLMALSALDLFTQTRRGKEMFFTPVPDIEFRIKRKTGLV
jgi:Uncharacterized conserved protein